MTNLLTRAAILAAPVQTTEVEVPEWGGSVHVRALSAKSRMLLLDAIKLNYAANAAWEEDQAKPEDKREGVPRVDLLDHSIVTIIYGICDEAGELMFSLADYDVFRTLDYNTIVKLWLAMENHSRQEPESEVKKNSARTRKGGSSSASRSRLAKP